MVQGWWMTVANGDRTVMFSLMEGVVVFIMG
jgi:hypothetical protein